MSNLLNHAQALETEGQVADAIQAYDNIIRSENDSETLAYANFRLGHIYQEWGELFAAQRFLSKSHQLDPENTDIREAVDNLNQHFSQNREDVTDQMSRQNSDQIVSLFRIATGIKLLAMDKPVQAYPLMKKPHQDIPKTQQSQNIFLQTLELQNKKRNSAIEFLIERDWLVNIDAELYTIADSGLYAFYTTLAQLHIDNSAYSDAITCYEQAYWLDNSQLAPLYQKVICYAAIESWNEGISVITELPAAVRTEIDEVGYYTAVAQCYHHIYQESGADSDKQKVIETCEAVLRLDRKDKEITKLLASYQGKKSWWRR